MYGYPAPEAMEEAEKGNLKLGGCEVFIGESPIVKSTIRWNIVIAIRKINDYN